MNKHKVTKSSGMALPWSFKFGVNRYANETNIELNYPSSTVTAEITPDPLEQNDFTKFPVVDEPDAMIKNPMFRWIDVLFLILSIGSFLLDTGTDVFLAFCYYKDGQMWYFGLTVAFIIIPALTMTGFSLRWYILDANNQNAPAITMQQWIIRIIFLLLQLGPILRYVDALLFALKMRKHKDEEKQLQRYYLRMSFEDADAALLRLFESFLEAAPQLVLQLYIMAQPNSPSNKWILLAQSLSAVASLFSLAWSLVAQHRALRLSLKSAGNMSNAGTFVQFLWRFFIVGARMISLGLFASLFPVHLAAIVGFRWIIMTIWIIAMKTEFCDTKYEEYLYNAVLGLVFTFCYFNPKDEPTRWRYFFYYLYTFTENSILISVWYVYSSPETWYRLSAVFCHFLSFFMGLTFMVFYYLLLHPNHENIKAFSFWGHFRTEENCRESASSENGNIPSNSYKYSHEEEQIFEDLAEEQHQPRRNKRRHVTRTLEKQKEKG